MKNLYRDGFTLMELMVALILIGMLAGFAVTSYQKSFILGHEKTAVLNLKMLKNALELYRANNGVYWDTGGVAISDLTTINNALGTHIQTQAGEYYTCTIDAAAEGYQCSAVFDQPPFDSAGDWAVTFEESYFGGECCYCQFGPCPSCQIAADGGCPY